MCLAYATQLQPLTPLVDEFASRLFGELDYMAEGRHAEKFAVSLSSRTHIEDLQVLH